MHTPRVVALRGAVPGTVELPARPVTVRVLVVHTQSVAGGICITKVTVVWCEGASFGVLRELSGFSEIQREAPTEFISDKRWRRLAPG
jgi:hypothetical protein